MNTKVEEALTEIGQYKSAADLRGDVATLAAHIAAQDANLEALRLTLKEAVVALEQKDETIEWMQSLLIRVQTHLAVGCVPQRGYNNAHKNLAIEIDEALK